MVRYKMIAHLMDASRALKYEGDELSRAGIEVLDLIKDWELLVGPCKCWNGDGRHEDGYDCKVAFGVSHGSPPVREVATDACRTVQHVQVGRTARPYSACFSNVKAASGIDRRWSALLERTP